MGQTLGAGNLRQHTLALATQRLQSYGARDGWHGSDRGSAKLACAQAWRSRALGV